ncbi:hypothetical protein PsYK624_050860 [Phanerochaete sordida]|uniref:Uncharacterized protein n=1 Tax=Phanerochaete sordida TaxID=48140 RepID=A0A9P3G6K1_9APHY|nr:hypothetical protein PsYK624_050860 [Phanerochaete sordida]
MVEGYAGDPRAPTRAFSLKWWRYSDNRSAVNERLYPVLHDIVHHHTISSLRDLTLWSDHDKDDHPFVAVLDLFSDYRLPIERLTLKGSVANRLVTEICNIDPPTVGQWGKLQEIVLEDCILWDDTVAAVLRWCEIMDAKPRIVLGENAMVWQVDSAAETIAAMQEISDAQAYDIYS